MPCRPGFEGGESHALQGGRASVDCREHDVPPFRFNRLMRRPLPPLAATLAFIDRINHDRINHTDLDGLVALMTDDHELRVLTEPPVEGREAWRGYMNAFPEYVIYPLSLAERGDHVAVLGTTTGSHLGLSDEVERKLTVLWVAEAREGRLARWSIIQDTPEARERLGLASH